MATSGGIQLTFPDGRQLSVPIATRAGDALSEWNPAKGGEFLAALFDGIPIDLDQRLDRSGTLAPLTFDDRMGRDILQHSSAHLVAKAVVESIPEAKPTVGPPTEEGFYYDFDVRPLTPEDMARVLASMERSIELEDRFERREMTRDEAELIFASNPHKLGYIREIPPGELVSAYATGSFVDLCKGPHVPNTRWLRGIHVLGYSAIREGGTRDGAPLQRIRGVGFPDPDRLKRYLKLRAEAEARDHRVIGPRLELFLFGDEAPGFPFWLPKGMIMLRELERFVTEHLQRSGYSEVRTPLLFAQSVYETSGHWEHYRENMFLTTTEDRTFGWKPMNCPGSMLIFRSRARSYRELPMRLAEFAPLHRLEPSGTLHGLTRVREMVQDDAHIFVTEEQVEPELRVLARMDSRGVHDVSSLLVVRTLHTAGRFARKFSGLGSSRSDPQQGSEGVRRRLSSRSRRGGVLRSQDRCSHPRLPGTTLADRNDSARLPDAAQIRTRIPGSGWPAAHPDRHPSDDSGNLGTIPRRIHRTLFGTISSLVGARPTPSTPRHRSK